MALQYFKSGPKRGLLICFICTLCFIFFLGHEAIRDNIKSTLMKNETFQDNAVTEPDIEFTNISVLKEHMIKG